LQEEEPWPDLAAFLLEIFFFRFRGWLLSEEARCAGFFFLGV
jgi:hypothetical protein